jgi:hypothetical protein
MTLKRGVRKRQRRWANSQGLAFDARGYVATVDANLFRPLSPAARADFERGDGTELSETAARPAKMRALTSSAALVANVFDHFVREDPAPLLAALGLSPAIGRSSALARPISFEARFPTGLAGHPPNVDVALELASGTVVGIESKFTEWFAPKRGAKAALKDKYFGGDAEPWSSSGLPKCQALAADLKSGRERFRFLAAAQLLKHALGLATQHPAHCALRYLYFDVPGRVSSAHRDELARFAARVDADIAFEAMTYQQLYRALRLCEGVDAGHIDYLSARYFA